MKCEIELDICQVDTIILTELKRYYISNKQNKSRVDEQWPKLELAPDHERANYLDYCKIMKALKLVIKHYTTKKDFEKWNKSTDNA